MNIQYKFDQSVLLQQSSICSRTITWGIIGITALTIIWASVFKIDESIPATGKLEPQGAVKEIKAPVSGVVQEILVKDGQRVKKGEPLINLEQTTSQAQISSLKQSRVAQLQAKLALEQENDFYYRQVQGIVPPEQIVRQVTVLGIKPELAFLTKSRMTIVAENQLYRAQLHNSTAGVNLTSEQQLRLQTRQVELASRLAGARLETNLPAFSNPCCNLNFKLFHPVTALLDCTSSNVWEICCDVVSVACVDISILLVTDTNS